MNAYPEFAIGEFCETGSGGTPDRSKQQYYGGSIPWVKSGELREDIIRETEERITELGLKESSAKLVPRGSILLAMYGATVGRMAFLGIDAATNQAICNVRPDLKLADPRYVFHGLQSKMTHFLARAAGGAQPNISQAIVRETKLVLPPLDEQRRIAEILDKADGLRRKRKRGLDLIGEMVSALTQQCLSGREIELGGAIIEGPTNGLYKPSKDYGDGAPILRIDSFYDGKIVDLRTLKRLRVSSAEMARFQLRVGDIVVNRVNSLEYLGKSALVRQLLEPTVFESNMMRFSLDTSLLLPAVCIALLQTSAIRKQVLSKAKNAVNQSSINQGDVRSLRIPLPSMDQQRRFVDCVERLELTAARMMEGAAKSASLFSSLQHRAFTGQL